MSARAPGEAGEIYFEYSVHGVFAKATAIEAVSGLEASIVGPRSAMRSDLERLALKKLEFVKAKRARAKPRRGKGTLA
jgi:hypothetical protein